MNLGEKKRAPAEQHMHNTHQFSHKQVDGSARTGRGLCGAGLSGLAGQKREPAPRSLVRATGRPTRPTPFCHP